MNKSNTTNKPINQRMLMEMLNLSSNSIRHLKETNQLKFKRVGTQDFFDEVSVKRFMDGFDRNDYLTVGRCKKILERCRYYTIRDGRLYVNLLGIYVTVAALIKENPEIPSEYRLHPITFGKTQYINREEFKKTLNWMRDIRNKQNPYQKITNESDAVVWEKSKKINPLNRKPKFKKKTDLPNESESNPSEPQPEIKTQRQIQIESLSEMVRNSGVMIRSTSDGKKPKGRLRFPQVTY